MENKIEELTAEQYFNNRETKHLNSFDNNEYSEMIELLDEYANIKRIKSYETALEEKDKDIIGFHNWVLDNYKTSAIRNGYYINPQELDDNYYTTSQLLHLYKNQNLKG